MSLDYAIEVLRRERNTIEVEKITWKYVDREARRRIEILAELEQAIAILQNAKND